MPIYRTQFTVATTDNTAANFATNTFHCNAVDETNLALFNNAVRDFYLTIDAWMGSLVRTTNGLMWKSYDLADPEPRVPVLVGSATLAPAGTAPLPPEVSLCLSFQAVKASGQPQASRRNRVFLPFLDETQNSTDGRPSPTLVTGVANAADALWDASEAASDWSWIVHSPIGGDLAIVDGWVDNEWDTQRRRGRPATSRTVFPP